ncbi:related to protein kinase [Rhynchosporium secalis]|uniref:Related to protein kinase n=1 Tax=Rhynchosporium secalis TaxID=38038 RepID=A0A1E1MHR5_RHYSE|nr:related to protein kinase [Rhynchosporium secalis]
MFGKEFTPLATDYFEEEMNVIRCIQKVIDNFSDSGVLGNERRIDLNTPEVWTYDLTHVKVFIEPFIGNYRKFISNRGWTPMAGNASGDVMQALSHFSYHVSYGQLLLCDLQGGVYQNGFILSDPVIMSPTQNYGPLDLGIDGINSFFSRHRCGFFCDKQWTMPPSTGPASYAEPSSDFSLACSDSQGSAALETARMG